MSVSRWKLAFVLVAITVGMVHADDAAITPLAKTGDALLDQALKAEVEGDRVRREVILASAINQHPDHAGLRWHTGQTRVGDAWLSVDQAEQAVNAQGKVADYRQLRSSLPASLASEVMLARWCRKHGLNEQAKLHWINVLSRYDRNHAEARVRLGVREYDGQLLTPEQAELWQEQKQRFRGAWRTWHPRVKRWHREFDRTRSPVETEGWKELDQLEDPLALPALMAVFHDAEAATGCKLVEVLGRIDDQMATDALVQLAITSDEPSVRRLASEQLSQRSWFTFVPRLLGYLDSLVELEYSVQSYGLMVTSQLRYRKENEDSVHVLSDTVLNVLPAIRRAATRSANSFGRRAAVNRRNVEAVQLQSQHANRIESSLWEVQRRNSTTQQVNSRVHHTLCSVTGLNLESSPQSLWDWWKDYNDYERVQEKPIVYRTQNQVYRSPDIVLGAPRRECFPAGTPVWTETGPMSIEQIRRGDRVLSQDSQTGELGYRFVSQITTRSKAETLVLRVGDSELTVTNGHPFWVIGHGWKMAKHLEIGDRLRRLQDEVMVEDKQVGPEVEVFNLIVPDTHSYFVGPGRLLVHDATMRMSPPIRLPGWDDPHHPGD